MTIPNTVEIALIEQANAIVAQRVLGNASTARAMFNQIPDNRKPLVIYYMIKENSCIDNPMDIHAFVLSVTT